MNVNLCNGALEADRLLLVVVVSGEIDGRTR
jgi:hypothetical protein